MVHALRDTFFSNILGIWDIRDSHPGRQKYSEISTRGDQTYQRYKRPPDEARVHKPLSEYSIIPQSGEVTTTGVCYAFRIR